jgi:hypothetical protein
MASRRKRRGSGTGGGPFGDLLEVFQPSRRHAVEETERQRHAVQLPESGAPPVVDLDAGTVLLPPPVPVPVPVPVLTVPDGSARAPDGDPPP